MERIAIIGYSGHAYVVLDACKKVGIEVQYYCEKNEVQNNPFQLKFAGDEGGEDFNWDSIDSFVLGIGDNIIRQQVVELVLSKKKIIKTVIHISAVINDLVNIGQGTVIAANTVINPLAIIGDFCILNTGCIIEHECIIADGVHIAPGAVLAGNVKIGQNTFIGANAVIKQGVKIGSNVIIGAGAVILQDITHNEKVVGNPGRKI